MKSIECLLIKSNNCLVGPLTKVISILGYLLWKAVILSIKKKDEIYEGNPIVTAEAQATGLTCYISERVTKRAKLLDSTKFIGIENASQAAKVIVDDCKNKAWDFDRIYCNDVVKAKGYDKRQQINMLETIYEGKWEGLSWR